MIDVISFWVLYGATAYVTLFIVLVCIVYLGAVWLDKITNNDFRLYQKSDDLLFKCAPFIHRSNGGCMATLFIISFILLAAALITMYLPSSDNELLTLHQFITIIAEFLMPCGIYVTAIIAACFGTSWLNKAYIKFKGFKHKFDKL